MVVALIAMLLLTVLSLGAELFFNREPAYAFVCDKFNDVIFSKIALFAGI